MEENDTKEVNTLEEFNVQARCVNRESKAPLIEIFRGTSTVDIELVHMLIAFSALSAGKTFDTLTTQDLQLHVRHLNR